MMRWWVCTPWRSLFHIGCVFQFVGLFAPGLAEYMETKDTHVVCVNNFLLLPSSFPFVRSLSCLSSNTSTDKYCSLLLHDDSKESLSTRRSPRRWNLLSSRLPSLLWRYVRLSDAWWCYDNSGARDIHRHAVDGAVTKFLSVCACVYFCYLLPVPVSFLQCMTTHLQYHQCSFLCSW
jgi:hypothetical protein